jgi:putative membrane protein
MVDPLHLFSPGDRERIRRAVADAQHGTAAKFAFAAVPAADHYAWFPVVWAAVSALVATGILALLRPHLGIGWGVIVNAGAFMALCLLFDWWPIRVRLVPPHFRHAALANAAHRAYAAHLISKDDAHNGVMLFVSLAERHLEIVAERDAHTAVPAGTWDTIVAGATATMRRKGAAVGLEEAIKACGAALAAAFPANGLKSA